MDATPTGRPNGLELSCPAEAGNSTPILAHAGGPGASPYGPARRVSFSELVGVAAVQSGLIGNSLVQVDG